jgi:hypothetical protein
MNRGSTPIAHSMSTSPVSPEQGGLKSEQKSAMVDPPANPSGRCHKFAPGLPRCQERSQHAAGASAVYRCARTTWRPSRPPKWEAGTICQSHGIDIVGRCSALVGSGTPKFAYMMRYAGFAEREAEAVERHGGTIMMVSDFVSGVCLPRMALMIAWPDIQAHYQSRRAASQSQ